MNSPQSYDYFRAGWHEVEFVAASKRSNPNKSALVLPMSSDGAARNRARLEEHLDTEAVELILEMVAEGQITGDYKEFNLIPLNGTWKWVLLMGIGEPQKLKRTYRLHDRVRSLAAVAARHFLRKNLLNFAIAGFEDFAIQGELLAELIAEGINLGVYRFERYKSDSKLRYQDKRRLQRVTLLTEEDPEACSRAFRRAAYAIQATYLARNLINTPSMELTPEVFAAAAEALAAATPGLKVEVFDEAMLKDQRMNMHLAVARGSTRPPRMVVLEYQGTADKEKVDLAIVGKGVTFDTGGYNIKPTGYMFRMYGDMSGGAAALGAIAAIARLELPIHVVAAIPLAENAINGEAYKPSDILVSRKGLTVEVTNTDAEGRLLLADALDFVCERYAPKTLVDIATLTGSVRTSLGNGVSGLFLHSESPDEEELLAEQFMNAGRSCGEWVWRFPVDDSYRVQLASDVADFQNADTDRMAGAGSITAAVFLKQFIDFSKVNAWAHIDIAGTALMQRRHNYARSPYHPKEGATGVGVRLLAKLAGTLCAEPSN